MSDGETQAPKVQEQPPIPPPSLRHNRDFVILWTGQLVSQLGTSISGITLPLLVLALTGSAAQAGFAGFLSALPYVIFSLPAGALLDRWNRKRVMIICDAGRVIALGSIPLAAGFGHLSIIQLYGAVVIEGTLFTFFNIAEVAAIPRVVPTEQLPAATSQNQVGQIGAFLVGPPIGGFMFQVLGKTIPYLFDAISYAASIVSLFLIRTEFQAVRTAERRSLKAEILEGLSWLWRQPLIRFMAFLTGGLNFVSSGLFLLTIVLAKHQHASPTIIGFMFALASVGGIIGSLIGPRIQKRFSFGAAVIVLVWIQVLVFPLFAVAPNPFFLGLVGAAIFVCGPAFNVVVVSYRLALIPDELQGRVNSAYRLLAFGFQPLGVGITGLSIEHFGAVTTVLLFSVVFVALGVMTVANHHVRHAPPLAEAHVA